jgi:hypothetical protein
MPHIVHARRRGSRPICHSCLVRQTEAVQPDDVLAVDLTDDERRLLRCGLREWGGPARCTEQMAVAMGFVDVDDLFRSGARMRALLKDQTPMSRLDWGRALLATEVVFASAVMGAGWDWSIVTGMSDAETVVTLRGLQRKLTREVRVMVGAGLGTRPDRHNGNGRRSEI